MIGPSSPSDLTQNATPDENSISLLQVGEKDKFMRKSSATDKTIGKYGRTITGDQFIGELIKQHKVLIPQSMDRWGGFGPLFEHFLLGSRDDPPPLLDYDPSLPKAKAMNKLAISPSVPCGILNTANKCWIENL